MDTTKVKEGTADSEHPEYETVQEDRTLNSMVPIWQKKKSEVTDEEYNSFYKEKFYDFEDPVEIKYRPVVVETENEPVEDEILVTAEKMPEFPGGNGALLQYLNKNIKYPVVPQEQGIQGRVIIQFVVDKDGTITDPVVVRSVDPYLDKEALRVIKAMPKWKPGIQGARSVRVKYTVPVTFRLQ